MPVAKGGAKTGAKTPRKPRSKTAPAKRRGRPPKILQADVREKLFQALVDYCAPIDAACAWAGISPQTWYNWKAKAEAGEQPYSEFLEEIKAAEFKAQVSLLRDIRFGDPKIDPEDPRRHTAWQRLAWILERRYHHYRLNQPQVDEPADEGEDKMLDVAELQAENAELRERIAGLEAQVGGE